LEILEGENCTVNKIVESTTSFPFGLGNKVTVIKNSQKVFESPEKEISYLKSVLEKGLPESNYLLFIASSIDNRKNFIKFLTSGIAEVKVFDLIKPWEVSRKLYPWIEESFRKSNKRIEQSALEALVNAAGTNKHRLEKEIEKLILYSDANKLIKYDDVVNLVVSTESDIFELLDFLAQNKTGKALLHINRLILKENHIKIIISLSTNFRNVYNVKLLAKNDLDVTEIAKQLKQKPFLVEKSLKTWKNLSPEKLRGILKHLMEIEIKFKSTSVNPRFELEKFIIKNFANSNSNSNGS